MFDKIEINPYFVTCAIEYCGLPSFKGALQYVFEIS